MLFFPFAMALAASSDLLTMKISNKLVLALVAGFFVSALIIIPLSTALNGTGGDFRSFTLAWVTNIPLQQVAMHIACATIVLVVAFCMFALRWIGGGDAKLAAATTLWLGFGLTLPYLVYAGLLGGGLTLLILALRTLPLSPLLARFVWLERLHDRKSGIPYGIALAIAGMVTYSASPIFQQLTA
ncbi:prepilin peptidase [Devosia algicola]|uniref:Prepilin peptidase n=1 Tax=Devosia algicola TaxID=3026418 RepID=A0ABY7YSS1_9HYPH|nr:prepilin peptidase [Devosia algicola]WDR04346.1 prepilin peptidase [Devosia algicola]